jgi:hypothetical protein
MGGVAINKKTAEAQRAQRKRRREEEFQDCLTLLFASLRFIEISSLQVVKE